MKIYKYIARNSAGQKQEAVKSAASLTDLLNHLHGSGFIPVSVKEIKASSGESRLKFRKRIKSADLASFCWQLSTMIEGGISVTTALSTIAEDSENLQFQQVIYKILERINKGKHFAESISEFPKVFNKLSCSIILAGETGGNLSAALQRLGRYYNDQDKLKKKIQGAISYPIFVLTFISMIVIFIMAFIVPRFRIIFNQSGNQLPAFTKAFLDFYDMLCNNLITIIVLLLALIISSILAYTKTQKGHYIFSKIKLGIPLLGNMFTQSFLVMFCRTMATLLAANVSVMEIFDILISMTSNDIIKSAIVRTKKYVTEGSNLHLSVAAASFFPALVVKMMQVGEDSGSLSAVLEKTADYYEQKVDSAITASVSVLEPLMIVFAGAIVLVVVVALYLPIFSMSKIAR
jgi:type IV pilus assembly protein PilC